MTTAIVYNTDHTGKQEEVCRLTLTADGKIATDNDHPTGRFLLGRPIDLYHPIYRRLTAADGEQFLHGLPDAYSGTRLRVALANPTDLQEANPGPYTRDAKGKFTKGDGSGKGKAPKAETERERMAIGECFQFANKLARGMFVDEVIPENDIKVVHAIVAPKWHDRPYSHAWVEAQGLAYDWQMRQTGVGSMPIKDFLKEYNPQKIKRYTPLEAIQAQVKAGHHGPWDDSLVPTDVQESNPGPYQRDSQGRFAGGDGDKYFNVEALERAKNQPSGSREVLTHMSPDDFLRMADEFMPSQFKTNQVDKFLSANSPFETVPNLTFEHDGKGNARVTGHEGRHRATALKKLGVTQMPVVLLSAQNGIGFGIRWGEQSGDYAHPIPGVWPKKLKGQRDVAAETISFPISDIRDQSKIPAEKPKQPKPKDPDTVDEYTPDVDEPIVRRKAEPADVESLLKRLGF